MYPIFDILCSSPTMNTHSRKWNITIQDPMEHLDNETLNIQYFFALTNTIDNHKIVQVIQSDTTSYDLQDLDEEDITEWRRVKTKNVRVKWMRKIREKASDEPPHQILLYALLFLLFHYFLYIGDPPLCTPCWCDRTQQDITAHVCTCSHTTLTLTSSDQSCLFDGQVFYDSHALFPFLVAQHVPSCSPTNHGPSHHVVRHLL